MEIVVPYLTADAPTTMGILLSSAAVSAEEEAKCEVLNQELEVAWRTSFIVEKAALQLLLRLDKVNRKRRTTSQMPIPTNLAMAEKSLERHVKIISYTIWVERQKVARILPPQGTFRVTFPPQQKLQATLPKNLDDKIIKRFVERYNWRAEDGIRGCWSERTMGFIRDVERWNTEELCLYAANHESEWEMAKKEFSEIEEND